MPENSPNQPPLSPHQTVTTAKNSFSILRWVIGFAVFVFAAHNHLDALRTILTFIVVLGVLVFVHEWGHYQFGLWGGMKINRFGIGFPPWIYTKRHKGIDYSIGALPIGGMVDIAGLGSEEEMVATAQTAKASKGISTAATTVENLDAGGSRRDAELTSYMTRNPDAPHGTKNFQDATLGWRFMTLFAGPLMNFIFALVMFIGVFSIWGIVDGDKSAIVSRIATVRADDPADKAGLHEGDRIVGINGVKTTDPATLSRFIESSGQVVSEAQAVAPNAAFEARATLGNKPIHPVTVMIERDGQTLQKAITPTMADKDFIRADGSAASRRAPAIGIEFDQDLVFKKVGIVEAAESGVLMSVNMTYQLLKVVGRAFTFQLSSAEKRGIGGPVKIAQAVGKASKNGPQELLLFAGLLSVNLGMMNLLPFPALDGGRILFLGYELVFRKPINAKMESVVHMAGMVMLLAFMLFITVRDVLPWITKSLRTVF